jgi:fused signal recognition particle receptor
MGLFDKIKNIGIFAAFTGAGEEFYDELEERLILSDMGVETAAEAVETLRRRVKEEKLRSPDEVRACLRRILAAELDVGGAGLDLSQKPAVVLFIGVNGVGKTTTIGKLAARLKGEGKRVLVAPADTFRAAAAEQLDIWAERTGVDIVKHGEGADPGAVVYDAMSAARARGTDVVLVDTAGRLHNKQNLMRHRGGHRQDPGRTGQIRGAGGGRRRPRPLRRGKICGSPDLMRTEQFINASAPTACAVYSADII